MKRSWLTLTLAVTLAPVLGAQQQGPPPGPPGPRDSAQAEQLRRRIEERFAAQVKQELRLTDDQATKLRATQERFGERRRTLMRQQMERRRALGQQMQPGVAANADSVRKLMDGTQAGRGEMLRLEQEEDRDMAAYLTPVQRARYQMMRERLHRRVNEMRDQRRGGRGPGMRPGQGPRGGPAGRGGQPGPSGRPI